MAKTQYQHLYEYGYRAKQIREILGVSQGMIAKWLGVSTPNYCHIEYAHQTTTATSNRKLYPLIEYFRHESSRLSDGEQVLFLGLDDLVYVIDKVSDSEGDDE